MWTHFKHLARFLLRKGPASFGIAILFTAGWAMIFYQFGLGVVALGIASGWGIGAWLFSDYLANKKPRPPKRNRSQIEFEQANKRYNFQKWSVPFLVLCQFLLSIGLVVGWMNNKKIERAIEQRNSTYTALTATLNLSTGDDPLRTYFAFVNGGQAVIIVTDICAYPRSLYLANNIYFRQSKFCAWARGESHRIGPGGDGGSSTLFSVLGGFELSCADLTIVMTYRLEAQPAIVQQKPFRFVTRWSPSGVTWLRQSVEEKNSFCEDQRFQAPYGNMIEDKPTEKNKINKRKP
jgi:hypothetical protein